MGSTATRAPLSSDRVRCAMFAFFRGPSAVYATAMAVAVAATVLTSQLKVQTDSRARQAMTANAVFAGLRYIWNEKLILGLVSLDLFAVLLGGAVALLPVYCTRDFEDRAVGTGDFAQRAGSGCGVNGLAACDSSAAAQGRRDDAVVCCRIRRVYRDLRFLASTADLAGCAPVCRSERYGKRGHRGTLVQLATPDEMRGRVNAVEMLFVGASNQLGQFESGITARGLARCRQWCSEG